MLKKKKMKEKKKLMWFKSYDDDVDDAWYRT
jgi:hypothetical protein